MRLPSKRTGWIQAAVDTMSQSRRLRRYLGRPYLGVNMWIWNHLPATLTSSRLGWMYGAHLHRLIQLRSARMQHTGTFFFRNRPELQLLTWLLDPKRPGSTLDLTILGCSKGAEVYSFSYAIRCARPDLKVRSRALDIDSDVLEFAKEGLYSLKSRAPGQTFSSNSVIPGEDLAAKTFGGQMKSVFERMSSKEIDAMFEREGDQASVKPRFREGLAWHVGDAGDPKLVDVPVKRGDIIGHATRDQIAVAHDIFIHPFCTGVDQINLNRGPGCNGSIFDEIRVDEQPGAVTDGRNRFMRKAFDKRYRFRI